MNRRPVENSSETGYVISALFSSTAGSMGSMNRPISAKDTLSHAKLFEKSMDIMNIDTSTHRQKPPFRIWRYFFVFSSRYPVRTIRQSVTTTIHGLVQHNEPVYAAPKRPKTISSAPNVPASSLLR
jgi:hypothetical protein